MRGIERGVYCFFGKKGVELVFVDEEKVGENKIIKFQK